MVFLLIIKNPKTCNDREILRIHKANLLVLFDQYRFQSNKKLKLCNKNKIKKLIYLQMGTSNSIIDKNESILVQSILGKKYQCKIPLVFRYSTDGKYFYNFYIDTYTDNKGGNEYFSFIEIESGAQFEIIDVEKRWGIDSGKNLYIYAKLLNNPKTKDRVTLKNKTVIIACHEMYPFFNYIDKNGQSKELPKFICSVKINRGLDFDELLNSKIVAKSNVLEEIE